ncbi:hypothetical protein RB195_011138 [Necator americanus]|uniref:Transposase n=1 Tax=Necator americanus TaxID=51031 RepID=A0ABR1D4D7_NECAM
MTSNQPIEVKSMNRLLEDGNAYIKRFKAGNKKLKDEPRSGRPTAISFDELKNLAEQHPYEGVRYFTASLGYSLSTVSDGLRSLGMVKKLEAANSTGWTPLSLEMKSGSLCQPHPQTCDDMPDPFVKGEIHEKKVMLSVWWGVHEIYRFELLPDNTTLANKTSQKILELGWEVLPHPPYGPDLAPATTNFSDRFSITWKRSATMIVTTSKMTFGLSSPPSRRISTPKESVIW